jgi:hypothetical protein
MSEYSISYHVRVGDSRAVQKRLRQAKFSGITFGPANSWLTFVPYADSARYRNADGLRFANSLCKLTGLAILHYCYAEDHGWSFTLVRADCPLVQFACWWNPRPSVERDQFDPLALAPFIASELLEPLLRSFDHNEAFDTQPAYRFAELLGLPAYKWLSPELAQNHTDDLLAQGGRKLGTKPAGAATRLRLPPNRKLELPQPYLSAREALDLIVPLMAGFKPPWSLTMLTTNGSRLPDGRGVWQARWRYGDTGDMVWALLLKDGRLSFSAHTSPSHMTDFLPKAMELPERWLDSTHIAPIVERLPVPDGFTKSYLPGMMMLRSFNDLPLAWVIHFSGERNVESFACWRVIIDAVSGNVMAEHLGRLEGSQVIPARQRVKGGDWEDLTAP